MKRREILRSLPVSLFGAASLAAKVFSDNLRYDYPLVDAYKKGKSQADANKPLAIQYTEKVRDMLIWIRETQSVNLLEASYAIADTVKNKRICWYSWDLGHSIDFDLVQNRNGLPGIFTVGYDTAKTRDGDFFLNNITGNQEVFQDLGSKDITMAGSPVPWGSDAREAHLIVRDSAKHRLRPYSDIWIETNVDTIGAIMYIPGMPAPVGPVSGIIGMVTLWMMVADACRILARKGISLPVQGDEPELSGDNIPWVSLYDPLMDDYFEQVMLQIEMIGAELGDIQRAAGMTVDSLLSGGKVWGYSRDRMALAVEAQTRRGGLALTRGIFWNEEKGAVTTYEGEPVPMSSNDTVMMGLFEPEDEIDLKCLDTFRKNGMKVVSFGPMTRDTKIPDGRTVPKEADVHIGRMCDTYGLYAVPGFKRKVCPTSGALLNQIFWATCMTIVEEVKRRTGNVPGVFFSAAVRGGTEHMYRMNEWWKDRGY